MDAGTISRIVLATLTSIEMRVGELEEIGGKSFDEIVNEVGAQIIKEAQKTYPKECWDE